MEMDDRDSSSKTKGKKSSKKSKNGVQPKSGPTTVAFERYQQIVKMLALHLSPLSGIY